MSDIKLQDTSKIHIRDVAAKIDIPEESLVPYGHDIAKINFDFIEKVNLILTVNILVTAISLSLWRRQNNDICWPMTANAIGKNQSSV